MSATTLARPRVVTCNVASVDGRLTLAPDVLLLHGDPRWDAIAGGADPYTWVRDLHDPQVLLEGSGSLVAPEAAPVDDDGRPPDHEAPSFLPAEVVDVPGRRWMAIVDGRGRVELSFTEWPDPAWAGWHALVITTRTVAPGHLERLRAAGIPYLVAGDGHVDLPEALGLLRRELGVRTVVATGGGQLGGALLRAGVVDEVDLELLPAVIGGRGTPALFDAPPLAPDEDPVSLELLDADVRDDGHVRLRYAVRQREGSGGNRTEEVTP